ncbi:MATE family efflux transporter [Methylobacterium oryzihabitans]|uniref:MATE family efflux transporter n=1 Tax=Methylobacterium oryzihabitans TaxID=2499852 RepID=A0A3S2YPY8_9HYPH|nr:MATE family efflux transporter [Methylobacterium oryzihabitans]RVU16671.1 MATE family efflux transporter [Methylobacterium oryzihabitans]
MPEPARFVEGPILRHVVVMAATGSVGLMAVFLVDFLSLLYVSWLGDPRLTAAVGFATIVQVFAVSITIGTMIAVGALVSRALGQGDVAGARRIAASSLVISGLAGGLSVVVLLAGLDPLLALIGSGPESAPAAARFLWIALPANVAMALGLGCSGVLRAVGDARRAMSVTLAGAAVTAVLDPLLIFGLGLGVEGAALAAAASRLAFAAVGWHGAVSVHRMVARPTWAALREDARPVLRIALPAVLTNLAPPVANAFLAHVVARYGTAAVAGNAVIDRLVPVAFGGLFALSGAVGPILGQNWGAGRFDRMRRTLRDAALVTGLYMLVVWAALALGRHAIARLFHLEGAGADLLAFFCLVGAAAWFFNGLLFVANAAFNNLDAPLLSTGFNWGRTTLGTMPFAWAGAQLGGPEGAVAGVAFGSLIFGTAAFAAALRLIARLERAAAGAQTGTPAADPAAGYAPSPVGHGEVRPALTGQ